MGVMAMRAVMVFDDDDGGNGEHGDWGSWG